MGRLADDSEKGVWAQQADESDQWYARFLAFRNLGWGRSIVRAFETCAMQEGLNAQKPGTAWYRAAKRWQWDERAEAWDEYRAALKVSQDNDESAVEPQVNTQTIVSMRTVPLDRAGMITRLLMQVFQSLEAADLDGMDVQEARNKLPAIRMLFKDLLEMHRVETAGDDDEQTDTPAFTADELIAAQRELERWRADNDGVLSQQNDEQSR